MIENNNRPYVQHNSGNKVYLDDLKSNDFPIQDIAHALSLSCRYNGQCSKFFSVAEHSWNCSQVASKPNQLAALLHDASEYCLTDIPRPIKQFIPGIREFEDTIHEAIFKKYGLQFPMVEEIHTIDNRMLHTEALQLMPNCDISEWGLDDYPPYAHITTWGWKPTHAKEMFLDRWYYLVNQQSVHNDGTYELVSLDTGPLY